MSKLRVGRKPKGGKVPDVPYETTEAQAAANRVRNWKHGQYAKVVTNADGLARQFDKTIGMEGAADVAAAYVEAIAGGDMEALSAMSAQALTETELLRRTAVHRILDDGIVVSDDLVDSKGGKIGSKLKAHPLLEHVHKMNETLGHTAEQRQLTPKSRDEGARDAAVGAYLKRMDELRSGDKSRMLDVLPINTTAV